MPVVESIMLRKIGIVVAASGVDWETIGAGTTAARPTITATRTATTTTDGLTHLRRLSSGRRSQRKLTMQ